MAEAPEESIPAEVLDDDTSPKRAASSREAYNVVTDVLIGVNTRVGDNVFQGLFTLATIALLAGIGAAAAALSPDWELPWYGGALLGAGVGLVVGVFASGVFLMIYRAVRHLRGKHD